MASRERLQPFERASERSPTSPVSSSDSDGAAQPDESAAIVNDATAAKQMR
jgi:hypothetical protein